MSTWWCGRIRARTCRTRSSGCGSGAITGLPRSRKSSTGRYRLYGRSGRACRNRSRSSSSLSVAGTTRPTTGGGFFWGDRFKSLWVEDGDTLINLLAYVDLNFVRAGIVDRPAHYRWCSLGHHSQTGNPDGFLFLDFGLRVFTGADDAERFRIYLRFVYAVGSLPCERGALIDEETCLALAPGRRVCSSCPPGAGPGPLTGGCRGCGREHGRSA